MCFLSWNLERRFTGVLLLILCTFVYMPGFAQANAHGVRVLATTYPVYLLTRRVAQDCPALHVELLIPAQTGCPHEYALTPRDVRKLSAAEIVVINGLGMEHFMETSLAQVRNATVIDSSTAVAVLGGEAGHNHTPGEQASSAHHGGVNAHAFSSPVQAAHMVRTIAQGLHAAAPEVAHACLATADAYATQLEEIGRRFAAIGSRAVNKDIVLLHDGLAYLVRDADLHLAGIIQEDEDVQPSAARLLTLRKEMHARRPAALIGEPQYDDKPLRTLAAETDVPVLVLDSLASGPEDAPLDYYERVMNDNCRLLEQHLVH